MRSLKQSFSIVLAAGTLLSGLAAAQAQPVLPNPSGPFEVARLQIPTDAELQQIGMTREQADAWIATIIESQKTMLERSRNARAQKLELGRHNTFMTDLLFFTTALPAERRTALIGDVEPTAAFARISRWIGEFMTQHVQRQEIQ